ncbi:MAG TPA: ATP-binding protein [Acidobacteriota bacterium]
MRRRTVDSGRITGRLRPADPFDLIRWLARSQSDPRKALAELVQNSLDAGASEIQIVRGREHRVPILRVLDNGGGVLPDMERTAALEYLATHIGQSLKQRLSVEQRHELMMQGKYGIGILGFWSLGEQFEIASQVDGSEIWRLVLWEDQPTYRVERVQRRLDRSRPWTEVAVRGLHRAALNALSGRRVTDYLAVELRGQLLKRAVRIEVIDRIARGRAQKRFRVEPRRFKGQLLSDLPPLVVAGFPPASVELYLVPAEEARGRVALACRGTIVADDLAALESFELSRAPWDSGELSGLIDFPAFEVAPGSRRGVVPDQVAYAFFEALRDYEPVLREYIERERERRAAALETNLLKELRRVLREMPQALPQYDFFPLLKTRAPALPQETPEPAAGAALEPIEPERDSEPAELFPPGPLAQLAVRPAAAQVLTGADRPLLARALDDHGRRLRDGVHYAWSCRETALGEIEALEAGHAVFHASFHEGAATIEVIAREGERSLAASAVLEVVASLPLGPGDRGIPEPDLIQAPAEDWRSRVRGEHWEVNSGHSDFLATAQNPKLRLRYLLSLLAKEVVLRSFGSPADAALLEKLVEVLAFAERRLTRG